jgi:hypothetical protein
MYFFSHDIDFNNNNRQIVPWTYVLDLTCVWVCVCVCQES